MFVVVVVFIEAVENDFDMVVVLHEVGAAHAQLGLHFQCKIISVAATVNRNLLDLHVHIINEAKDP